MQSHYNVLFLCTGNSARSIMAEAIMNRKGGRTFTAYSAGSHPSGIVRPEAIKQLDSAHLPTKGLRSKSWDEFSRPDAPPLSFVFTVCDNAAKEVCPFWPGQPMTAHWGIPDPLPWKEHPSRSIGLFVMRLPRSTGVSVFLSPCLYTAWTLFPCNGKSTILGSGDRPPAKEFASTKFYSF